jgi:hypothetical protein
MTTKGDGTLWLENRLSIDTYKEGHTVQIGKLDTEEDIDIDHGGRIIDSNGNFVVYEDGHVIAKSGSFKGHLEAESGSIGEVEITN